LAVAHGVGARIGQKIDEHILSSDAEQVVVRVCQDTLALFTGGLFDRFDDLDAEGFNKGDGHGVAPVVIWLSGMHCYGLVSLTGDNYNGTLHLLKK
jgi:hypothetical protein